MLDLSKEERKRILDYLLPELEGYLDTTSGLPVSPELDPVAIKRLVRKFELETATDPVESIGAVLEGLKTYAVHTPPSHVLRALQSTRQFLQGSWRT
jgi:hypothetical protein